MAFEELKERQSVMWGSGPYQRVTETLTDVHELVVERLDPRPGVRWLDLATGTGAARVEFFDTEYCRDGAIDHDREHVLVLGTRR